MAARSEWFRNETWTPEIESTFLDKLRRARDKGQYLKIQASILAASNPNVALSLLERFFVLKEDFFLADAFVTQANAYLALEKTEDAVGAYKRALEREHVFPNLRTTAWSAFSLLVADRKLRLHFDEALKVLDDNRENLLFPSQIFAWNGAYALIHIELGQTALAREHAFKAIAAATKDSSGLPHHPKAGLVRPEFEGIVEKLEKIG